MDSLRTKKGRRLAGIACRAPAPTKKGKHSAIRVLRERTVPTPKRALHAKPGILLPRKSGVCALRVQKACFRARGTTSNVNLVRKASFRAARVARSASRVRQVSTVAYLAARPVSLVHQAQPQWTPNPLCVWHACPGSFTLRVAKHAKIVPRVYMHQYQARLSVRHALRGIMQRKKTLAHVHVVQLEHSGSRVRTARRVRNAPWGGSRRTAPQSARSALQASRPPPKGKQHVHRATKVDLQAKDRLSASNAWLGPSPTARILPPANRAMLASSMVALVLRSAIHAQRVLSAQTLA